MAHRRTVTKTSDVSGEAADETMRFSVDDQTYRIDLTSAEADRLRAVLQPYIAAGRQVTSHGKTVRRINVEAAQTTIRAWARSAGVDVPARGRIPNAVRARFEAAQGGGQSPGDATGAAHRW